MHYPREHVTSVGREDEVMSLAVTVLYFDGCPSWRTAMDRLQVAATLADVRITVSTEAVETPEDADRLGFTGSPTIVIAGRDPFALPGKVPAMACRVYTTPHGLAGAPTVAQLVDALRQACWCCGNPFEETDLTRLGAHPEVGVCAGCAQWVNRRARSTSDNGLHSPAVVLRRGIDGVRERAINAGAHHWPLVGPLLTRLDRHLP